MRRALRPSLFLAVSASLLLGPVACTATGDSCEIKTSGISTRAFVTDDGDNVRAYAWFEAGDMQGIGTRLDLCESDEFTINGQATTRSERSDRIEYGVTWSKADAPQAYEFLMVRRDDDNEEIAWTVTLPPAFEITAPAANAQASRAADLEITWDPAGSGDLRLELDDEDIDCTLDTPSGAADIAGIDGVQTADDGLELIPAGTITVDEMDTTLACPATLMLVREQAGEYPAAFKDGGRTAGLVERRVAITSIP
jgi:hypothetical protein